MTTPTQLEDGPLDPALGVELEDVEAWRLTPNFHAAQRRRRDRAGLHGKYDCCRCGWKWTPNKGAPDPPYACAFCRSAYWNTPPKSDRVKPREAYAARQRIAARQERWRRYVAGAPLRLEKKLAKLARMHAEQDRMAAENKARKQDSKVKLSVLVPPPPGLRESE